MPAGAAQYEAGILSSAICKVAPIDGALMSNYCLVDCRGNALYKSEKELDEILLSIEKIENENCALIYNGTGYVVQFYLLKRV